MSKISDISRQYQKSLEHSKAAYEKLYTERQEATQKFYREFLHKLTCPFGEKFRVERTREWLQEQIEKQLGTTDLHFIAVDGTCRKESFSDFITFFGGAYGSQGQLTLGGGNHQVSYKRWSLDHDVSMVAWVPVPFAQLEDVTPGREEDFLINEEQKINLSSVHTQIMQLAEVFLAYNAIRSSLLDRPHLLLMDLSVSSVLASVAVRQEKIGLVGYPYDRRALTKADITIAMAYPFSKEFDLPSPKMMDLYRVLIAELAAGTKELDPEKLATQYSVEESKLTRSAEYLVNRGVLKRPDLEHDGYTGSVRLEESLGYTRDFFQNLCRKLFLDKDPNALTYEAPDDQGTMRRRWMSPDDLNFLIALGFRLLVQECWERKVLLYGVVKDSSSKYFARNFLGVSLELAFHQELAGMEIGVLPWTDRMICEMLPLMDENLNAPWGTIEFDSAFMTLHRELGETGQARVAGVMGRIVNQERLFARSLGQFFLKRDKAAPLMGHVVFLERLLTPGWDRMGGVSPPKEILIDQPDMGRFTVYAWQDRDQLNVGQMVMMYLLSVLCRNHFSEAVGYPDPLHKADWGAKTIGRGAADTIRAAQHYLKTNPLVRTFRSIRDSARR